MSGNVTSACASLSTQFQEQTSASTDDASACKKVYLVYSPKATEKNDYHHVAVVQTEDGNVEHIPYTKLYHDHNWNGWQDRCVWKDAYHIATVQEDMIVSYTSTHGMSTGMMPVTGDISLRFRPK